MYDDERPVLDEELLQEIELLGSLVSAASRSSGVMSQTLIDDVLGVLPVRVLPAQRESARDLTTAWRTRRSSEHH